MNATYFSTSLPTLSAFGMRLIFAVTLVWLLAGVFAVILRRSSAAMRHRCWALSVLASLAVPVLVPWLPEIRLGWLQSGRLDSVQGADRSDPRESASMPAAATADFRAGDLKGLSPERALPGASRGRTLPAANVASSSLGGGDRDPVVKIPSAAAAGMLRSASGAARETDARSVWLILFLAPGLCVLSRLARATLKVRRIVAGATAIDDPSSLALLRTIGRQFDGSRSVELRQSSRVDVPFCTGWSRPCIVLPDAWRSWSPEVLRAVLAHELSHVIRRDVAWQDAATVACACYWFHPLAWLAAWRMRIERESACDDAVLRAGERPTVYAHLLVEFTRCLSARATVPPTAIAMAAHSRLESRVRAILDSNRYRAAVGPRAARLLSLAALIVLLTAAMLSPLPRNTSDASAAGDASATQPGTTAETTEPGDKTAATDAASGTKQTPSPKVPWEWRGKGWIGADGRGIVQNDRRDERVVRLREPANISGRVVLGTDPKQGVGGARILGVPQNPRAPYLSAISAADGSFRAACVRSGSLSLLIQAQSADRSLSGIARIWTQDTNVVISVGPTASAHGRLVEMPEGKPVANRRLEYVVPVGPSRGNENEHDRSVLVGGVVATNARGEFTLSHLAPGWKYELRLAGAPGRVSEAIATFTPRDARTVELGDVRNTTRVPHMLTWEEQIAQAMRHGKQIDDVFHSKLEHARLADQRVLIIAGSPKSEACRRLLTIVMAPLWSIGNAMNLTLENQSEIIQFNGGGSLIQVSSQPTTAKVIPSKSGDDFVAAALADYAVIGIDTSDPHFAAENRAFFERLKVAYPAPDDAILAVIDVDGRLVSAATGKEVSDESTQSSRRLLEFLFRHAAPTPDAAKLLDEALAQAKREHKRVLVRQNAARCDLCESLSRYLDKHKSLIEKEFVCVKLDERYRNGRHTLNRVRDAWEGGLPWMAILDADGKPLITSDSPRGNIGFPESPQEISYFAWMLRATARNLTEEELQTLIQGVSPDNSKKDQRS
jgi:beta-lactamase regulating signal transducer with metallopeptidase domain